MNENDCVVPAHFQSTRRLKMMRLRFSLPLFVLFLSISTSISLCQLSNSANNASANASPLAYRHLNATGMASFGVNLRSVLRNAAHRRRVKRVGFPALVPPVVAPVPVVAAAPVAAVPAAPAQVLFNSGPASSGSASSSSSSSSNAVQQSAAQQQQVFNQFNQQQFQQQFQQQSPQQFQQQLQQQFQQQSQFQPQQQFQPQPQQFQQFQPEFGQQAQFGPEPLPTEAEFGEQFAQPQQQPALPSPTLPPPSRRVTNYPLPGCYADDDSQACCHSELQDMMKESVEDLFQNPDFHECNLQKIANTVDAMLERRFGHPFEVITGISDFASKSQFHQNLFCKVERAKRFILAYATPKANSTTTAGEGGYATATGNRGKSSANLLENAESNLGPNQSGSQSNQLSGFVSRC